MQTKFDFRFFGSILCFIWLLFSPLPVFGRRTLNSLIDQIFEAPTRWIRQTFFSNQPDFDGFYSDSLNYLILLGFGAVLTLIMYFIFQKFSENQKFSVRMVLNSILIYALAWVFLVYGFSKLHGYQFPDLSHLNLADFSENRDIFFWQWLGNNPILVVLLGIVEVIIALGLFLYKSRKISLIAFIIMVLGIFLVNWYYTIGVLTFSTVLLFSAVLAYQNLQDNQRLKNVIPEVIYKPIKLFCILCLLILGWLHNFY